MFKPFPFSSLSWMDFVLGFFLLSFLGWLGECFYAYHVHRRWINRGFLAGPICPIYGAGAMAVSLMLLPIQAQLDSFGIFLFGGLICSVLEYITSYAMEKIWNLRWWDYSKSKFNLNGRICLGASLGWGILCVFLLKIIDPLMFRLFHKVPLKLQFFIAILLMALFLLDAVHSVISSARLSGSVRSFAELNEQMKKEREAGYGEIAERWEKFVENMKKRYGQRRLLKAFPSMSSTRFAEALGELRERLETIAPHLRSKEKPEEVDEREQRAKAEEKDTGSKKTEKKN